MIRNGNVMMWQPLQRILAANFNGIDAIEQWLQDDLQVFAAGVIFEIENLPASGVGKVTRCINKRNADSLNQ